MLPVCGIPVLAFPHQAIKYSSERDRVAVVGQNVDDAARWLVQQDPSELRSNLGRCRRSLLREDKIGQRQGILFLGEASVEDFFEVWRSEFLEFVTSPDCTFVHFD